MCNKSRLRGESQYIEHDLTWNERQIQEKINGWMREERERERAVRTGYARVQINGIWVRWIDIEKKAERKRLREEEKIEEEQKQRKKEREEERSQNFTE